MDFFEELKNSILEASDTIGKKSERLIEIQKLKMKKSSLDSERKRDYLQLGKLSYQKMKSGEALDSQSQELYDKLNKNKEASDEIERQLTILKGVIVCPNCKAEVGSHSDFCPQCGAKIEKPVKPEVVDDDNSEDDFVEEECTIVDDEGKEEATSSESSEDSSQDV